MSLFDVANTQFGQAVQNYNPNTFKPLERVGFGTNPVFSPRQYTFVPSTPWYNSYAPTNYNLGSRSMGYGGSQQAQQYTPQVPEYKPPTAQEIINPESFVFPFQDSIKNNFLNNSNQEPFNISNYLDNTKNGFGDVFSSIAEKFDNNVLKNSNEKKTEENKTNLSNIWNNPITKSLAGFVPNILFTPETANASEAPSAFEETGDFKNNNTIYGLSPFLGVAHPFLGMLTSYNNSPESHAGEENPERATDSSQSAKDVYGKNYGAALVNMLTSNQNYNNNSSKPRLGEIENPFSFLQQNIERATDPSQRVKGVYGTSYGADIYGSNPLLNMLTGNQYAEEKKRTEKNNNNRKEYVSPLSDKDNARINSNIESMYNNLVNSDSNWYEKGIGSDISPLLAQPVLSANTRDYYGSMAGIGPRDLNGRQARDLNLLKTNTFKTNPMARAAALLYNPNQEFNPNNYNFLIPALQASEMFGTYTDSETGEEKPITWNPTHTMPLRSLKQYKGVEEESPYVEDMNFMLANTPGGREYTDMLDATGRSSEANFADFRYLADDDAWRYFVERGWEPYYEAEDGIGLLKRDKDGRIINEDMDKVITWLNDPANIFYLDEAINDPNSQTWNNFGGSSSDILSHLDLLNRMSSVIGWEDPLTSQDYINSLGDLSKFVGNLDENDRALYAALDLLDRTQGGKLNKGSITEGLINALFEKTNEPYRVGKLGQYKDKEGNDLYLDYKTSGRNKPLKANFNYFFNDNQYLTPYDYGNGEAGFYNNMLDSILWRNQDYGIQTQDNIDKYTHDNGIKKSGALSKEEEKDYKNSIYPDRLSAPIGLNYRDLE